MSENGNGSGSGAHRNGSSHILKWMLGIGTAVISVLFAAVTIWLFGTVIATNLELLRMRDQLHGVKERVKELEIEQRNIKRLMQMQPQQKP